MKLTRILLATIFLLIISITGIQAADKGYDKSGTVTWTQSSGNIVCPSGKSLFGIKAHKSSISRTGTVGCYRKDNAAPAISVNYNGYTDNVWTKQDVNLNISISDSKSGLGPISYTVNGAYFVGNSNIDLNFTEEGTHKIIVTAYDKAIVNGYDGGALSANKTNKRVKTITVKIDRTAPIFTVEPETDISGWFNTQNQVNFTIEDAYKGIASISKIYDCGTVTPNASWSDPVTSTGMIERSCLKINDTSCATDIEFLPAVSCNYECNSGYERGLDGLCYIESNVYTCDNNLLPTTAYTYDWNDSTKTEDKIIDTSTSKASSWIKPYGVTSNGDFTSFFQSTDNSYVPSVNECEYECTGGYHEDNGECINDIKIVCCNQPPLSVTLGGTIVDCSLADNQDKVECSNSSICGWKKEILGVWNYSELYWNYSTNDTDGNLMEEKYGESGRADHCGYELYANSDGNNCSSGYSLLKSTQGKPLGCLEVGIGYWSGSNNNDEYSCTNGPSNSIYTTNGTNNNCQWVCKEGYTKKGNSCKKNTWETSSWSTCSATCDGGSQSRTTVCKNTFGTTINDTNCLDSKPDTNQSCNTISCSQLYSYDWEKDKWGACGGGCGKNGSTKNRNVWCERNDGVPVNDSFCDPNDKDDTQDTCTDSNNDTCEFIFQANYYSDNKCQGSISQTKSFDSKNYNYYSDCMNGIDNYQSATWDKCTASQSISGMYYLADKPTKCIGAN